MGTGEWDSVNICPWSKNSLTLHHFMMFRRKCLLLKSLEDNCVCTFYCLSNPFLNENPFDEAKIFENSPLISQLHISSVNHYNLHTWTEF